MGYDSTTGREEIAGVVTEDVASEIIQSAVESSAALSLFPHLRMSQKTRRLPVLAALPLAYWVDGEPSAADTSKGLKSVTNMAWDKKYLTAEELAVIVPIPEAVLDDATFDIFGEIRPRLGEAIGAKLDAAVFAGDDIPASWVGYNFPGLAVSADDAGNNVVLGTAPAHLGGVGEDLNQLFATVEADGFDVSMIAAERTFRAIMRSARDTTGQKLADVSQSEALGVPVSFTPAGTLGGNTIALAGDRSQGILGIRQDITYKVLTEAVIQDESGNIVYNLAQQDMVALRVVFRAAFQVANPINRSNDDPHQDPGVSGRYPFAVLQDH
jgi:HK97 family phage major capsid protein